MPHRPLAALAMTLTLAACGSEDLTGPGGLRTGTYAAALFVVTPPGQASRDVLAAGGGLAITINADGTTSGTLTLPASVTGGAPLSASMAGTVTVTSLTVTFAQQADTFVRALTWSRQGELITVSDQVVAGTAYTITLLPQ